MARSALTHPPVPGTPGDRGGGVASRRRTRPPAALLVPALVAAGVALLPLVYLAVRAFERGPAVAFEIVWQERTLRLVLRSLLLAAVVTGLCLVVGVSRPARQRCCSGAGAGGCLLQKRPPCHVRLSESTLAHRRSIS